MSHPDNVSIQRKNAILLRKALKNLRSDGIQAHCLKVSHNSGNQRFWELVTEACNVSDLKNLENYLVSPQINESKSGFTSNAALAWKGDYDKYIETLESFNLIIRNKGNKKERIMVELIPNHYS